METKHNVGEHYKNLESHWESTDSLKKSQANYDLATGLRTEATAEEEKAAEEMMTEAKQELDKVQGEYDTVIAQGKEIGDQEKNMELWLEAYQEHYEFLMGQARELKQKIDLFKSTLQSDKLLSQAKEQPLPTYVSEEITDEVGRNRVRYLFMEMFQGAYANAKAEGSSPHAVLGTRSN